MATTTKYFNTVVKMKNGKLKTFSSSTANAGDDYGADQHREHYLKHGLQRCFPGAAEIVSVEEANGATLSGTPFELARQGKIVNSPAPLPPANPEAETERRTPPPLPGQTPARVAEPVVEEAVEDESASGSE